MAKRDLKEYRIWKAMKSRCYSPSQKNVGYYQRDGIKVCERWRNDFSAFMDDMGKIPGDDYSIERIDIKKDYCPENCKWIPRSDQTKNRRNTIYVEHEGENICLKEFSRRIGMKYSTVYRRFRRNEQIKNTITQ